MLWTQLPRELKVHCFRLLSSETILACSCSCHADALAVDAEESRSRLRLLVVAKEVQTFGPPSSSATGAGCAPTVWVPRAEVALPGKVTGGSRGKLSISTPPSWSSAVVCGEEGRGAIKTERHLGHGGFFSTWPCRRGGTAGRDAAEGTAAMVPMSDTGSESGESSQERSNATKAGGVKIGNPLSFNDIRRFLLPGDIANILGGNVWGHCGLIIRATEVYRFPVLYGRSAATPFKEIHGRVNR
eukprot:g17560.t1